jgi:hypothetical protein
MAFLFIHLNKLISVLIALCIGIYVGRIFFNSQENHGPNSNFVRKETFFDGSLGCYKMKPVAHVCPLQS